MLLVAVQTMLAAFACYSLWRLLRVLCGYGRVPGLIIGVGFVARAIFSQVLFWISYLRLPYGRSLQLGPGFWFFGLDSEFYFQYAATLAHHPWEVLTLSDAYPARFFVQVFTTAVGLFGAVPSVGILLNCAAFAGICFLIARLGLRDGRIAPPAVFAIAAISFSPAGVLWSMQPLKDTLFLFVVMFAVAVCFKWYELWTSRRDSRSLVKPLLVTAVGLLATIWALSSMRWYFGLVVWLSCAALFVGAVIASPRKPAAIAANVAMFLLLPQIVLASGGSDVPTLMQTTLNWRHAPTAILALPLRAATMIRSARDGYDSTPGATTIEAGSAIADPPAAVTRPPIAQIAPPQKRVEQVSAVATSSAPPPAATRSEARPKKVGHVRTKTKRAEEKQATVTPEPTPAARTNTAPPVIATQTSAPPPATIAAPPAPPAATSTAETLPNTPVPTTVAAVAPATTTVASLPAPVPSTTTTNEPAPAPAPAPLPATASAAAPPIVKPVTTPEPPKRVQATKSAKIPKRVNAKRVPTTPVPVAVTATTSAPTPLPITTEPAPAPPPAPAATAARVHPRESRKKDAGPGLAVPRSTAERLITGMAATFLPRSIAQRVGLIRIGGGRGFWFFADLDTLVFDAVVLFAFFDCTRRLLRRRGRPTATFLLVAGMFVLIVIPVVYTVNNFGTLFRHRQMIYLTLALLPLALLGREQEREDPAQA